MRALTMQAVAVVGGLVLAWSAASASSAATNLRSASLCHGYLSATPEQQIQSCTSLIATEHNGRTLSALLTSRATGLLSQHKYTQAIEDLNVAISLLPQNGAALADRAAAHLKLGDTPAAKRDYAALLSFRIYDAESALSHGLAHEALDQPQTALTDYNTAIKYRPQNRHTLYVALTRRGGLREDLRRMDLALVDYDHASDVSPTPDALARACWARIALNYDLQRALAQCQGSMAKAEPGAALPLSLRAGVYYRMNRYSDALADCQRVLAAEPNDFFGLLFCGLARQRSGERAVGEVLVTKAKAARPEMVANLAYYKLDS